MLAANGLTKEFGGRAVLRDVDLTIERGEVHALVGENGSGKSTLIKLVTGVYAPTRGSIEIAGSRLAGGTAAAYAAGCRVVHQDVAGFVDTMTVSDNLSLAGGFPTRLGTVRGRVVRRRVAADLARVGVDVDPDAVISSLTPAARTGVAVAGVLREDDAAPAQLIIFDEPTATLPGNEVDELLATIRAVVARGLGVLYVTHRLEEVFEVADRVTVLRDGVRVGTWPVGELTRSRVIQLMTGDEFEEVRRWAERSGGKDDVALSVRGISAHAIDQFSLDAHRGEILGIAGVVGSGRESILGAIFGSVQRAGGSITVGSEQLPPNRPPASVRNGLAYLPTERRVDGMLTGLNARENMTISNLAPFWKGAAMSKRAEVREVELWFERFAVRPGGATELLLENFSGGNQQKILLARLLRCDPQVLLLDEPTHGVDIAAKAEIHKQIIDAASRGISVIVASSDLDEMVALCHRVVAMWRGKNVGEWMGDQLTVSSVMERMAGA